MQNIKNPLLNNKILFSLSMIILFVCTNISVGAVYDSYEFNSNTEAERFKILTKELRCTVCQNETLYDSTAPLAIDMRQKIYELLKSGANEDVVKQYLVDRYSEYILFKPQFHSGTYWLWFGPGVMLVLAIGYFIIYLRRINL